MVVKKSCFFGQSGSCMALETTEGYTCLLGYRIHLDKKKEPVFGIPSPLEQCPKPRTRNQMWEAFTGPLNKTREVRR